MSALQSAIKVAAPLYGGEVFQRVGHESRPQIIFWHYIFLAAVVWVVFPPGKVFPKRRVEEKRRQQESEEAQARLEQEQLGRLRAEDARKKAAAEAEEREREVLLEQEEEEEEEEEDLMAVEGMDTVPSLLASLPQAQAQGAEAWQHQQPMMRAAPSASLSSLSSSLLSSAKVLERPLPPREPPQPQQGESLGEDEWIAEDEADAPDTGDHLRPHGGEGLVRRRPRPPPFEGNGNASAASASGDHDHYQELAGRRREATAGTAGGLRPSFPSTDRLHPIRGRFDRGARVKIG